mmetsp:Transcript_131080/g.330913  ORF Transcript_131080/g.330913 Transcript_131080/m.330913 type:complete len:789 (+) Transcript_131080:73-2439(+)
MGDYPCEEDGSPAVSFHRLIRDLTASYDSLRQRADWLEAENARLSQSCSVSVETLGTVTVNGKTSRPSRESQESNRCTAVDARELSCYNGHVDELQRSKWRDDLQTVEVQIQTGITCFDSEMMDCIAEAAWICEEDEEIEQRVGQKTQRTKSFGLKQSSSMLMLTPIERACSNWTKLIQGMLYAGERQHLRAIWDEDEGRNSSLHTLGSVLDESSSGSQCSDVVVKAWSEISRKNIPTQAGQRRSSRRNSVHSSEPLVLNSFGWSTCCLLWEQSFFSRVISSLQGLMVHPYSAKRIVWVFAGLIFMGVDIMMLTMSVFGLNQEQTWIKTLELLGAVYWTLDIVASFLTGVYVNSNVIMELHHVAIHYVKTWFGFDAFVVIVQWLIIHLDGGQSETGIVKYVRVLRYSRLLRLAKFEQLLANILERINSMLVLLAIKMSMYLFGVVLYVHVTGTAWYWVGKSTEDGWVQALGDYDALPLNYLVSVHWASAQMQGNVDIYPGVGAGERAFAVCHILCSVVALASLVSKLTTVLHNMQTIKATKVRQVTQARRYLEDHAISTNLSMTVRKYVEWKQVVDSKRHHNTQESELLQILPRDLRRALLDETRSPIILKHVAFVAFRNCNLRFFERLCCDSLEPLSYMPDEHIFSYGMVCSRMYFMVAGAATYFKYGVILKALMHSGGKFIDGTTNGGGECKERLRNIRSESIGERSICEASIWVHWVHHGDVDTVSHVSILGLDMKNLDELVLSYPVVQMSMLAHARRFATALNELDELSDLFDSTQLLQDCGLA